MVVRAKCESEWNSLIILLLRRHSKVIPKGFRSNFHASFLSHCNAIIVILASYKNGL